MKLMAIPHRRKDGMCPVNGIRDLIQWRSGQDWSNELVHGLGQGGGFAYLRVNPADPPRQVYWGNSSPRQQRYLADLLGARYIDGEGRAFPSSWAKAREAVDAGTPPLLGPLDMYHLPFYPGLYQQRHIPIHLVLLVGYDEGCAHVQDTGCDAVQRIALPELSALTGPLRRPDYTWEAGQASTGTPILVFTYLLGYPERRRL